MSRNDVKSSYCVDCGKQLQCRDGLMFVNKASKMDSYLMGVGKNINSGSETRLGRILISMSARWTANQPTNDG